MLYESLENPKKPHRTPRDSRLLQGPELPDATVVDLILGSIYRTIFCVLYKGNWESRYGFRSEANLALTGILATIIGNNPKQIDRLNRSSSLF